MERMTPRTQDSQAAVVQNLSSNRLLTSFMAENSNNRHRGNSYRAECRTVGRDSLGAGTVNTGIASFLLFLCKSLYFFRYSANMYYVGNFKALTQMGKRLTGTCCKGLHLSQPGLMQQHCPHHCSRTDCSRSL